MFDVIAVDMQTQKVRILGERKKLKDAEAIGMMAVGRLGSDREFFVSVNHGEYKEGDKWIYNKLPETVS